MNLLKVAAGVGAGVVVNVGSLLLAPVNPTVRGAIGIAGTVGGLLIAIKKPVLGIAIATGSLDSVAGGPITTRVSAMIVKGMLTTTGARPTMSGWRQSAMGRLQQAETSLGGVYFENMGAYAPELEGGRGITEDPMLGDSMGVVYSQDMSGLQGDTDSGAMAGASDFSGWGYG
jgi:hypothetical protein